MKVSLRKFTVQVHKGVLDKVSCTSSGRCPCESFRHKFMKVSLRKFKVQVHEGVLEKV